MSFIVINFFMSKSFKTFLKHTAKDFHNQSVNPPVVRASTIIFKSMQHIRNTQAKAQKMFTGREGSNCSSFFSLMTRLTQNRMNYFRTRFIGVPGASMLRLNASGCFMVRGDGLGEFAHRTGSLSLRRRDATIARAAHLTRILVSILSLHISGQ